jgi:hypothetical protein
MNESPKTIWRRPWRGPVKFLTWFALLACAVFVILLGFDRLTEPQRPFPEAMLAALIFSLIAAPVGILAMLFIKWLCSWRNLRRFLFGVACFATLIALFYAVENWRGKRAWEQHKREWEAKGEKFTVAGVAPAPVPEDQNFALTPLLKPVYDFTRVNGQVVWADTNGMNRLQQIRADLRPDRESKDRLVLGSLDKGTFADLESWREFYRGNTNYPQPAVSGTAAEDILVALGKFDAEFKELQEARASRPYARFPIPYEDEPAWEILLPHLAHIRGLCMLTHVRAVARLELGQSVAALDDLHLGFRISDIIRNEPLLIDHLVRIAALNVSLQTVREGLVRQAWNDAQLAELEKYLSSLNLLAEYKAAMRGERALGTSGLDFLRRQGWRARHLGYIADDDGSGGAAPSLNLMPGGWFYQNMLAISKMHQTHFLASVDEDKHRVFPDASNTFGKEIAAMPLRPYTVFAKLLMPALDNAVRRSARAQVSVDAARLACALERQRLTRGEYPETIEALVPQFLETIPNDVIDGNPLRYRRTADGGYTLYSIGWNQRDDNGEIAWRKDKRDSTVDLNEGDWVWQMPGKPIRPSADGAASVE